MKSEKFYKKKINFNGMNLYHPFNIPLEIDKKEVFVPIEKEQKENEN